jgi:O-antigen ligase
MEKLKETPENFLEITFPNRNDFNLGIYIIGVWILIEFGSIAGMYDFLNSPLRLPLIISVISILYALKLIILKYVDFTSRTTKIYFFLCIFIIIYTALSAKLPIAKSGLIKNFVVYLSIYVILTSSVKTISQFILVIDIWLASILFSSFHGIMQGGMVWGNHWLRDENEMSLLAAIAFPFAFLLYRTYKSKIKRICYLICMIFYVSVNIIAHSRGGSLTLFVVVGLCWLFTKYKLRNLILILIASLMVMTFAPSQYFQELETLSQGTEESTADDRLYLWGIGFEMFSDHPMMGVGPSNYPVFFSSYDKGRRYEPGELRVPHSMPVQWLAEKGLVGFAILLLLQYAMFKNWSASNKKYDESRLNENEIQLCKFVSSACAISQIGFWFGALFLTLLNWPFYWILVPFSEAWKNAISNETEDINTTYNMFLAKKRSV